MMPRGVFVRRLADHPAPTPQATPCRIWQGALDGDGYGARTNGQRIHRWVMEQVVGRHAIGIDLDARNADLARDRVGMFLTIDERATA